VGSGRRFASETFSKQAATQGAGLGLACPTYFDFCIEAHLNGESAGATESSSRSGKVKSKKRKRKC
jgi:hypothetical protein